ncbi:MAG: hypothetical protein FWG75_04525 [Cystobacterineae bacterium]|nr:hypothetical protein [Cystobacterineae bacterium]
MRIKSMCLAAMLSMSLVGFESRGEEPADSGKKTAKGAQPARGDKKAEGGAVDNKHSCDTLTGIQELENQ